MARTLAEAAERLKRSSGWRTRRLPAAFFLTDAGRVGDPAAAVAGLPAGVAVILRHYGEPDRVALALRLAALCRRQRRVLLVAGDVALARRVAADGVHLPEGLLRRQPVRPAGVRPAGAWLVTAAAHDEAAVRRAGRAGVDGVLLSPVFATASHPGARALGPVRFAALAHRAAVPVYALGGIDARTVRRLDGTGAAGIAAIGALLVQKSRTTPE